MMPCGKVATTGPQRFPLGLTSFAGANLADDTMTIADEAAEPSFLVAVFSGFSVSTQSPDQRLPRPTRLSTLRSGEVSQPWPSPPVQGFSYLLRYLLQIGSDQISAPWVSKCLSATLTTLYYCSVDIGMLDSTPASWRINMARAYTSTKCKGTQNSSSSSYSASAGSNKSKRPSAENCWADGLPYLPTHSNCVPTCSGQVRPDWHRHGHPSRHRWWVQETDCDV